MPIIEYLVGIGLSDEEILKRLEEIMTKTKFFSFYIHDLFEGVYKSDLVEKIILALRSKGFKSKRIIDL